MTTPAAAPLARLVLWIGAALARVAGWGSALLDALVAETWLVRRLPTTGAWRGLLDAVAVGVVVVLLGFALLCIVVDWGAFRGRGP